MDSNKSDTENEHWDDLYKKIGRCVVLFQKIELLFKYAVSRGCFSLVYSTDQSSIPPIDQLKNNANNFSQKTMGCVGRLFCERMLTDNSYSTDDKALSKNEMRINFNLNFGLNNEHSIDLKKKIELIIAERNKIVHQLFNTFEFNSGDDFFKANIYIDKTYDNALILYNEITELTNIIPELVKDCFSNLQNIFVLNDLYNTFYEKELIVRIQYYSELRIKNNNSDSWMNLADACSYLGQKCPESVKECRIKHGTKSLKKIIEKFELFEIKTMGEKNQQKTLFRMKPEYWIEKDGENQLFLCRKLPDSDGYIKDDLNLVIDYEPVSIL